MQETKVSLTAKMAAALNQRWLAAAVKFSFIAITVIALYQQDLIMVLTGALTNEATYHILAIPFLFGYLLLRKRKMISATLHGDEDVGPGFRRYFSTLVGISLCAVAVFAYWYGSYSFTPLEYHMLTLPFLTAGLILLLFNVHTLRQLIFPVFFLFFLTPPPDEILYGWGSALSNFTAMASNSFANLFGLHSALSSSNSGPVITIVRHSVPLSFNVDVACSGIYSIIGFTIFAVFVAYITRGRLWNKFAIFIMGIPLILALNIIRITTLLEIGYNFGEDLALTFFHDIGATVLMFIGVLVLLAITDRVFKKPKPLPPCPTCKSAPAKPSEPFCPNCGKLFKYSKTKLRRSDLTKIVGVALAMVLLLSIQAPVFALTQGPAEVMMQTPSGTLINASNAILPNIPGYALTYAYRDTQFEQTSGDEAALVYTYGASNSTDQSIWVAIQISASITSEHRWETCLINFPLSQGLSVNVRQLDLRDVQIQSNPPLTARYFTFQYKDTNQTQVILYWYETATFNANGTAQTKSVMISLIMYPSNTQNIAALEKQELGVAQQVNSYWYPIQTWSIVALALSRNGLTLSIATSAVLVLLVLYGFMFNRREKKLLLNLYGKLSEQNKNVIKAVEAAQKHGASTTDSVLAEMPKLNKAVDKDWLIGKLGEFERAGLIKREIVNRNDEPAIRWKSNIARTSFFL